MNVHSKDTSFENEHEGTRSVVHSNTKEITRGSVT